MIEIYIADEGKKVPLEEAIKLLTDDFIVGGNSCIQTVIDLVNAARQLREELEAIRSANDVLTERSVAAMDIADGDIEPADFAKVENRCPMLSSVVKLKRKSIADTTALAAAKEALQTCRCLEPEQRAAVANAFARIAECEKES